MKTTIIANPASGSFNKESIERCAEILQKRFGEVTISYTESPKHATELAGCCGTDFVISAGGDGLANEVAAGVADSGGIFSVLPFGTRNVFCREFGIPLNPLKAAEQLNPFNNKKIPLGYCNNDPFLLMCGFGFDAQVVKNVVTGGYSKRFKTLAHVKHGFLALGAGYPTMDIYCNEQSYRAHHIIISLGRYYAGSFNLSNRIKENSLNVFLVENSGISPILYSILKTAIGMEFSHSPIYTDVLKVSGATFTQLDGEYMPISSDQSYISLKKNILTIAL